jgi:hypothetical protein
MTVVAAQNDIYAQGNHTCSICNGKLRPPFVMWMTCAEDLFFCSQCCRRIKNGLMADIIQVSAIAELNALDDHGGNATLVRRDVRDVEREIKKQEEAFARYSPARPDYYDE